MTVNEFVSGPVPAPIVVGGRVGYVVKNLSPDTILQLAAAADTAVAADLLSGDSWPLRPGESTPRFEINATDSFGNGWQLWHWTRGGTAALALTYD